MDNKPASYELIRELGNGGMGQVHLARRTDGTGNVRMVAVKQIRSDGESPEQLLREAKVAIQFHHQNVVPVIEVVARENDYLIAMDYVDGKTLLQIDRRVQANRRAELRPDLVRLISEACAGLHYVHNLGVIHRDLKLANIMVSSEGCVKVLDFGIAKDVNQSTMRGFGTLAYMSPEQIEGREIDRRSDVFALGATLFELCTGRRAFVGTKGQLLAAILKGDFPDPRSVDSTIPNSLRAIILQAMETDREKRFSSAEELQLRLWDYVRSCGSEATHPQANRRLMQRLFDPEPQTLVLPPTITIPEPVPISQKSVHPPPDGRSWLGWVALCALLVIIGVVAFVSRARQERVVVLPQPKREAVHEQKPVPEEPPKQAPAPAQSREPEVRAPPELKPLPQKRAQKPRIVKVREPAVETPALKEPATESTEPGGLRVARDRQRPKLFVEVDRAGGVAPKSFKLAPGTYAVKLSNEGESRACVTEIRAGQITTLSWDECR